MNNAVAEPLPITNEDKLPGIAKMIEPDPRDIVTVVYQDSLDSQIAAWVVYKAARKYQVPVVFVKSQDDMDDLTGRHVIFLGRAENHMNTWLPKVKSALLLDKHGAGARPAAVDYSGAAAPLPFRKWEREMPYKVVTMTEPDQTLGAVVKPGSSLALMAYEFFNADRLGFEKRPRIIDAVSDYAMGARKFRAAADICACLSSYDFDLHTLDKLADAMEIREKRDMIEVAGQAINRYCKKYSGVYFAA